MGPLGLGLILSAVSAALGYLLSGRTVFSHAMDGAAAKQLPKGDGAAAQPEGPAQASVPLPGTFGTTGGATSASRAAAPAVSAMSQQPVPVVPPLAASKYVPAYVNPESSTTQVD